MSFGVDDFVEGGEIDKKDYIIGNFTDVNNYGFFTEHEYLDNYVSDIYYDPSIYERPCDFDDMSYYLDIDKPKPLVFGCSESGCTNEADGTIAHSVVFECGCVNDSWYTKRVSGCGCGVRYKRIYNPSVTTIDGEEVFGTDIVSWKMFSENRIKEKIKREERLITI